MSDESRDRAPCRHSSSDHAIDDSVICRAAEAIGGVRRAEFVRSRAVQGPRAPARHSRDARRQELVPDAEGYVAPAFIVMPVKSGYPGLMLYAVLARAAGHEVRPGAAQ